MKLEFDMYRFVNIDQSTTIWHLYFTEDSEHSFQSKETTKFNGYF
mgnify:CR=1 FL=1